ncbi:MAG: protein kinase [SAR324 cluster bacterium]|uniref:Protein kinase n=1 Tax=SAR324 cluster bacterium TaxID=2024889 RepID=A0A7X9FSB2_9DELT|nr:protein kinase [SAR324 cluster bacterium]
MQIIAGKYEVQKVIGEGASGRVYLVKHMELGSLYALKLLDPTLALEPRFIDRFKTEAEILRRFNHPGSVPLRDFGRTEEGLYYMAMDFCSGLPLKDRLHEKKRFSVEETLRYGMEMLGIVEAAHQAGIIHRDIKPENIMIEKDSKGREHLRILDFGIAKIKEHPHGVKRVTLEGASIGTPQYMSPEQAAGEKDLDHRVDIYSVGIVLYELVSGKVPFEGKNVVHTLLMQITQPAPSFKPSLRIPLHVEHVILKALEKDAEKRYQSAEEFRIACEEAIKKLSSSSLAGVVVQNQITEEQSAIIPSWETKSPVKGKKQYKILCLDDQEMIINILKHLLENEGYLVQTSTNWAVIHEYLFSDHVDLLISDVEMPGMKGTVVCQILKETMPDLKIVLFSNVPERQLEKMAENAKADAWISKNWMPSEWLENIRTVLEKK